MQKPSCSVRYLYTQQTVLKDTLSHFLGYLILFIQSSQQKLKKQKGGESLLYNIAFEVSQLIFCFSVIFDLPFELNN